MCILYYESPPKWYVWIFDAAAFGKCFVPRNAFWVVRTFSGFFP